MTSKAVPALITLKAFNCPVCQTFADQTWFIMGSSSVDGVIDLPTSELLQRVPSSKPTTEAEGKSRKKYLAFLEKGITGKVFLTDNDMYSTRVGNLFLSRCRSCGECTVWRHDTILYPPTQYEIQPNEDLPDDIKADFNEARTILNLSPRGAAALLRLCIQKLCKHLGQPGKNINDDIASLVAAGLDPRIQKALDIVRVVGNEAVHPGTMDLNDKPETAANLFALVNRIAYDMITHPKEVDALYNALPADKTDAITKRDSKAKATTP